MRVSECESVEWRPHSHTLTLSHSHTFLKASVSHVVVPASAQFVRMAATEVFVMSDAADKANAPLELPPPSFQLLVATFASQATVAFGHVANPIDGKKEVRLELARHAIDMLDILQQKTKGNLTAEEDAMLEGVLHQLRMAFVEAMTNKPAADQ